MKLASFKEKLVTILDEVKGEAIAFRGGQDGSANLTHAGVIVPIVINEENHVSSEVLFTLRTQCVRDHKGQVSFPGGVYETRDRNLLETALRETREETGILESAFTIAGMLTPCVTATGYKIFPFVGLLDRRPDLKLSSIEIERAFYIPLSYLMEPSQIEECTIDWQGILLDVKAIRWEGMTIWGATFNIVVDLVGRLNRIIKLYNVR